MKRKINFFNLGLLRAAVTKTQAKLHATYIIHRQPFQKVESG
jgi:hypothetical protein